MNRVRNIILYCDTIVGTVANHDIFNTTVQSLEYGQVACRNAIAKSNGIGAGTVYYRVLAIANIEIVSIVVSATGQIIGTRSAGQRIIAQISDQFIVPVATRQLIIATEAAQEIVSRAAVKHIIAVDIDLVKIDSCWVARASSRTQNRTRIVLAAAGYHCQHLILRQDIAIREFIACCSNAGKTAEALGKVNTVTGAVIDDQSTTGGAIRADI